MRWIAFNVLLLLAVAGGWLHAKGVPVTEGVTYAYRTVQAPTDWDRYDWTAIGAGLVSLVLWWRKRPRFLRLFQLARERRARNPLDGYAAAVRSRVEDYIDCIEARMKEGKPSVGLSVRRSQEPDLFAAVLAAAERRFVGIRHWEDKDGDLCFGWALTQAPTKPDNPFA